MIAIALECRPVLAVDKNDNTVGLGILHIVGADTFRKEPVLFTLQAFQDPKRIHRKHGSCKKTYHCLNSIKCILLHSLHW